MYGIIEDPGKFEGELEIVPRMWDIVLEGLSSDVMIGEQIYSFVCLLAIDEPVDELYGAMLWEDNNGFVHSKWFETEDEYKQQMEKLAEE